MRGSRAAVMAALLLVSLAFAGCAGQETPPAADDDVDDDAAAADEGSASTSPPPRPVPWRFEGEPVDTTFGGTGRFAAEAFCDRAGCAGDVASGVAGDAGPATDAGMRQETVLTDAVPVGIPTRITALLEWDASDDTTLRPTLVTEGVQHVAQTVEGTDGGVLFEATVLRRDDSGTVAFAVEAFMTNATGEVTYSLEGTTAAAPTVVPAGVPVAVTLPDDPDAGVFMASAERFRDATVAVFGPGSSRPETVETVGGAKTWVPAEDVRRGRMILLVREGSPPVVFEPFGFAAEDGQYTLAGPAVMSELQKPVAPDAPESATVELTDAHQGLLMTVTATNATSFTSLNVSVTGPDGTERWHASRCKGCILPEGTTWRVYAGLDGEDATQGTYGIVVEAPQATALAMHMQVLGPDV